MIVTLLRKTGEQLHANCPDNTRVFNGKDWVLPAVGNYATLLYPRSSIGVSVQREGLTYQQDTTQLCLITAVDSSESTNTQIMLAEDPLNGECPCIVFNLGTQLLNIKVTT